MVSTLAANPEPTTGMVESRNPLETADCRQGAGGSMGRTLPNLRGLRSLDFADSGMTVADDCNCGAAILIMACSDVPGIDSLDAELGWRRWRCGFLMDNFSQWISSAFAKKRANFLTTVVVSHLYNAFFGGMHRSRVDRHRAPPPWWQ